MLLVLISVLLILAILPLQFYFESIFLVRLSLVLGLIFFLVFLIRGLFFKNLDRQLLRFTVAEDRLRIEYINKNKSLNKVHEILLSQLRGYSMFDYSKIPRQIGIIFKLKDHTKLRITLEYSKIINGTETQTEEIIEEIISSFRKYNANHIEKIRRMPQLYSLMEGNGRDSYFHCNSYYIIIFSYQNETDVTSNYSIRNFYLSWFHDSKI